MPATKKKTARRGRYKRKPAEKKLEVLTALGLGPEERLQRTRDLADRLEQESLLRGPQSRRSMAEVVAGAVVLLDASLAAHREGVLTADESRAIPTLTSAIRKLAETAGLDSKLDVDTCRTCQGKGEVDGDSCEACDGSGFLP